MEDYFVDKITLLTRPPVTDPPTSIPPTPSPDLPVGTDPSMIGDGDLRPWRVRLAMTNTGEDNVVNSGTIKLRIDGDKRFIQTAPILVDEDAKTKYLIEVTMSQRNPDGGADLVGKTFRFQLGSPSIDIDKHMTMLTISLQEIQYRIKETYASRELRFVSPFSALTQRVNDFNTAQVGGVNILLTDNKLPRSPLLEYVPQSPKPINTLFDSIFNTLSEATPLGGTFTDFYYDFDPNPSDTMTVNMIGDEIGRESTGVVLDPLSIDPTDSNTEQTITTNLLRFKNHVVGIGDGSSGSLPIEHSIYSSKWLHAKIRDEFNNGRRVQDRDGNTFMYLKGETCKMTFDTTSITTDNGTALPKVIRFFVAQDNIPTVQTTNPDQNDTLWLEDFIVYPRYDIYGRYLEGDIVYHMENNGTITFYVAKNYNVDVTLNRIRANISTFDSDHLSPATDNDGNNWTALTGVIPTRDINNFNHYVSYSPWTESIFDWEQNLVGNDPLLNKTNVLPNGTNNRYVGFVPDWNMTKDVYEAQDFTNQFENINTKWVHKHVTNPVPENSTFVANNNRLNSTEIYHGQRVLINGTGTGVFAGNNNKLAEYDSTVSGTTPTNGLGWKFSLAPKNGDTCFNFNDGKVYQYHTQAVGPYGANSWQVAWEVERMTPGITRGDPASPSSPFHIVKDLYKTRGFEGTPNSAIELRFAYDIEHYDPIRGVTDDIDTKAKFARRNSRGAWLWMWNPFPRLPHKETNYQTWSAGTTYAKGSKVTSGTTPYMALRETIGDAPSSSPNDWLNISKDVGSNFGGNGATGGLKTGFTTLNIFNTISDRFQSLLGWNNGLKTEDMGKISGISFKMRLGIFAQEPALTNDNLHAEIHPDTAVVGVANIPMTFWCVDDFDRIWFKKFTLRKNNFWDEVTIPFGDLNQANLHLPRWDELSTFLNIPLSFTKFALKQREYTGVAFDWRFVRGWGVLHNAGYDEAGFYNGGIDEFWEVMAQYGEQIAVGIWSLGTVLRRGWEALANPADSPNKNVEKDSPIAYAIHRQAALAIDDLHYVKELVVNSNDEIVPNPRTKIDFITNVSDYVIGKILVRATRERLSFFPQFWTLRSVGDVRMRVGKSFKMKGDRIPEHPDQHGAWAVPTSYNVGDKVAYNGFSYESRVGGGANVNKQPDINPSYWENMNELACAEVTHIVDSTGYHMEVTGRRKFITTGEV